MWLHHPANSDSFCTNPEIPSEKRTKYGRVGGGWAIRLVAALLSVFFSQMQAIVCDEIGVAYPIGAAEVSDP